MDPLNDFTPEALEAQVAEMEQVDEFNTSIDYDKFIVLNKKDLSNFCRVVEPLTKQAIDDYGKCVFVHCLTPETVQLSYINAPYVVQLNVQNKSGKTTKDFAIGVNTMKKLVTQAFASLILVEQENEINIALCESLLYLETKPLSAEQYVFTRKETPMSIDKERALYTFKKIGASLALTERASEKVIVVKDGQVNFNTGVFAARAKSPFSGTENFVLYKQVSDILAVFAELVKTDIKYSVNENIMALDADGFYAEVQIGTEDKVKEFLSPTADANLGFNATVQIINDNLLRIVTVVGGLEYLSDIVTLSFAKDALTLLIANEAQTKKSPYKFNIIEGAPEETGDMKVTVPVLKLFLSIVGSECKYSFTSTGLGIATPDGKFIIRRS
jgi:hypothetical protein